MKAFDIIQEASYVLLELIEVGEKNDSWDAGLIIFLLKTVILRRFGSIYLVFTQIHPFVPVLTNI